MRTLERAQHRLVVVLFEPSALLAEALSGALQARGHRVVRAERESELPGLALRMAPHVLLVADVLGGHDLRGLLPRLVRSVRVPVLAVGDVLPEGPSGRGVDMVGSDASLHAVVAAVEDVGRGKPVRRATRVPEATQGVGVSGLTRREQEVASLLVAGASTGGIATDLGVTTETARKYVQQVLQKLGAHSRLEAVSRAGLPPAPTPRVGRAT